MPPEFAEDSQRLLRIPGEQGYEGILLWAGHLEKLAKFTIVLVDAVVMPAQKGVRTEDGILAIVDGDEMFRLSRSLSERQLISVAQLHSHPTDAYHSSTDDRFALVTAHGALSIVVPNFARDEFCLDDCSVYRLDESGRWDELTVLQAKRVVRFGGNATSSETSGMQAR